MSDIQNDFHSEPVVIESITSPITFENVVVEKKIGEMMVKGQPFGTTRGKMTVDHEGMTLDSGIISTKKAIVKWADLRSLNDEKIDRGVFSADFGPQNQPLIRKIRIVISRKDKESIEKSLATLKAAFGELPPQVRQKKCTKCGGAFEDKVCPTCGNRYGAQNRQQGLIYILTALGLTALGVVWFLIGNYILELKLGKNWFGWTVLGPIVLGVFSFIGGLYKTITGR